MIESVILRIRCEGESHSFPKYNRNKTITPISSITLSAELLGGVKLRRGRRLLAGFATQKVVGLFCHLLDAGREPIARDKMMAMFWGESPEDQARYNLRFALWNIRKVFKESEDDPDPLISTRNVCQLNPDLNYQIDSQMFERSLAASPSPDRLVILAQALESYKGPFLDGFSLRNLAQWEEWLFQRRESLHQSFLTASLEVGQSALQSGQASLASTVLLRALQFAPDLEQAHEILIRAYADLGRTSAALRQFSIYSQVMRREHSAPPNQAIVQLTEQLRTGTYKQTKTQPLSEDLAPVRIEPELPRVPITVDESLPQSQTPSERLPQQEKTADVPFIGRKQEMKDIQGLIAEVISGQGMVLIISGEMGIGKTRLFSELLLQLPMEFLVGVGESREIESTRPLEDVMQVLESIGRDPRLTPENRAELKALFELQEKIIRREEETSEPHLLEGIRRWIVTLAQRQPILIALDDMHWAGEPLHKIFSTLAQEVKRLPILLVGIFRTFEEQSEEVVASALISIARTGRLRRIELGSLSYDDTIQIIQGKAPVIHSGLSENELQRIYEYSSGIPLYAVELANSLLEGQTEFIRSPALVDQPDFTPTTQRKLVPPLMLKIAAFRLTQLPPDYSKLLKIGSLVLDEFSIDLAQAFTSMEQDPLEDMLVDLEHRNLLHHLDHGGKLAFAWNHQMIKLAISDNIPELERKRLFREIVHAMETTGEPISTDALAYYLYNAGERAMAIEPLLASARFWFGYGDRTAGLRYSRVAYEIALERLTQEPEKMINVILSHTELMIELGLIKGAIDSLTLAIDGITTRPDDRSNLLDRRAALTKMLGTEHDQPTVERRPLAMVTAKRALANVKLLQGDTEGAAKLLAEVEATLEGMPDNKETLRNTGLLFKTKAKIHMHRQEITHAIPLLESAAELLRYHGTPQELAENYRLIGRAYRLTGEFSKAGDALENCYLMVQGDEPSGELVSYLHEVGLLLAAQDRYLEAEEFLSRALDVSRSRAIVTSQLPILLTDYARVLTEKGDKERAHQIAKQAEETSENLSKWGELLDSPG